MAAQHFHQQRAVAVHCRRQHTCSADSNSTLANVTVLRQAGLSCVAWLEWCQGGAWRPRERLASWGHALGRRERLQAGGRSAQAAALDQRDWRMPYKGQHACSQGCCLTQKPCSPTAMQTPTARGWRTMPPVSTSSGRALNSDLLLLLLL